MKPILAFLFLLGSFSVSFGQHEDAKTLYAKAKDYLKKGDLENANMYLKNALKIEPYSLEMLKDLAYINFLAEDYKGSASICLDLIQRPDADEQVYQILGNDYKATNQYKECTKVYKNGLVKFPESGPLYNEFGELLAMDKNLPGAIEQWEKGIKMDPNYSLNYYNATNYYARYNNFAKVLIYGEVFVNLESFTTRTADVKALLLEAYKKLYASPDILALSDKSEFTTALLEIMNKSKNLSVNGINADIITAIKTRFIIDWFISGYQDKFPFHLFDHQRFLMKEGLFEAYNQWIFGAAANPAAYEIWLNTHDKAAAGYKYYQQNKIYKIPANQFYF